MPVEHNSAEQPHLKRVLGRWDLVLLFVVAVFNLNVVPSIAANGGITVWLWVISILLFFWAQSIAVIELSHRYPGEGGVYLWAQEEFCGFHGFLSGWGYWANQMAFLPTGLVNSFGVICFGLVGLELASVMGDEIRDPARTLPGAVAWGGIISGVLYIATTLILLVAIGKNDISILQGIVQAVGGMAQRLGIGWIGIPFALMLSVAIAGIGSAWMGGAARIPFVAGLDSYMPAWMGRIHPRYATPHAALIVQFIVSAALVVINFGFH